MLKDAIAPWAEPVPHAPDQMTAAELAQLPDDGWIHELVEGRLVRMPLPRPEHGDIASEMNAVVRMHVKQRRLGRVFGNDTGFQLNKPGEPHTVLGADVSFVRAERVPPKDDPAWQLYFPFAPDLVVEIASPSQYRPELATKARRWLAAGTRLVWVVWPARRCVDIWHPGQLEQDTTLDMGDSLDGEDMLPDFHYLVADLFA